MESQYKIFIVQFLKIGFLSVFAILLLVGAISYNLKNKKPENVYAGTGDNMNGFAWSGNVGLISFNSTNCDTDGDGTVESGEGTTGCPVVGTTIPNYGVKISEDASGIGILSGYAWADKDHLGWISFNRTDTGVPPSSAGYDPGSAYNVLAYVDSGNKLQGWARALAACDRSVPADDDCGDVGEGGAGANSGGWDGWIALGDTKPSVDPAYGVSLNTGTKEFNGFAYGSDVIDWMSFNKSNCDIDSNDFIDAGNCGGVDNSTIPIANYKVSTTFELNLAPNTPSVLNVSTVKPGGNSSYCSTIDSSQTYLTLTWEFTDPNTTSPNNQQSKYEIFGSYTNGSFVSLLTNNQTVNTGGTGTAQLLLSELKNQDKLGSSWYGKTLYWKVKVTDNATNSLFRKSTESGVSTFGPMPNREYPYVTFYSNPALDKIFASQDTQFSPDRFSSSDKTICYGSGSTPVACAVWSWNLMDATPSSSGNKEPIVKFSSSGSKIVTLKARDGGGYECTATRTINVGLSLPKIQEKK